MAIPTLLHRHSRCILTRLVIAAACLLCASTWIPSLHDMVGRSCMWSTTFEREALEPHMQEHLLEEQIKRDMFNRTPQATKITIASMWTMTTIGHRQFAMDAISRINENNVEGDIVECGVWMGGMTMLMVFENMKKDIARHFWLFDTFEGLNQPSEKDGVRVNRIWDEIKSGKQTKAVVNWKSRGTLIGDKWNYGPLDIVKSNMWYTGYPRQNFHFIVGKVEETLPVTQLPEKIAIMRLDTDWYLSTKAELDYMYDRLQPGGVLIVDDFCAWEGSKSAVVEYFKEKLNLDAVEISKEPPCFVYWKS